MPERPVLPGGVFAALVTPLDTAGSVDGDSVARLVDGLIGAGVDGLCPVGSAGEGPLLGHDRRADMTRMVCDRAGGRVPVVPAISHNDTGSALAELERFARLGATAALVTAPTFYGFGARELTTYFVALADRSPVPLLVYDVPAFAGVRIGTQVVAELAGHGNIIGLKDSSGDASNLTAVLDATRLDEFGVYCGTEALFSSAASHDAAGVIGGSVNLGPELVIELWRAASTGAGDAVTLQAGLDELARASRAVGRPFGWKAAAAELGLCQLQYCTPVTPPAPADLSQLRRTLLASARWLRRDSAA